jgi:hypothetical protein
MWLFGLGWGIVLLLVVVVYEHYAEEVDCVRPMQAKM